MSRHLAILAAAFLSLTLPGTDRHLQSAKPRAGSTSGDVAHGDYLVHSVAMCVQCHSPRDRNGDLLMDEQLQGARMPVTSPFPAKAFAFSTPRLAGMPAGWTDEELVAFLQTGDTGTRERPQPPMPPFRMTAEDARAIVAYLKSLR
jgi:mono/diheme cytochrome c family protein